MKYQFHELFTLIQARKHKFRGRVKTQSHNKHLSKLEGSFYSGPDFRLALIFAEVEACLGAIDADADADVQHVYVGLAN